MGTVESYRFCKPELNVCFSKSVLLIQIFTGFSYTGFYGVLDHRKKIKTRFSCVILEPKTGKTRCYVRY